MGLISNGTTLFDSGSLDASVATGSLTHIKTLTASDSSTLSFVNGASSVVLDNTYKEYVFKFYDIHPSHSGTRFQFNGSIDTGSNYNVTKTTTFFQAYHDEGDTATTLDYTASTDLAQSTAFKNIGYGLGNDNDENGSGELWLFNPSNTTFVKHFMSRINMNEYSGFSVDYNTAGYFNTTSAIDAIQFKMFSGNIDSGRIALYGIK